MKQNIITESQKRSIIGVACTLDGDLATVCGAKLPFAVVASIFTGKRVEYAWDTAIRVFPNFKS